MLEIKDVAELIVALVIALGGFRGYDAYRARRIRNGQAADRRSNPGHHCRFSEDNLMTELRGIREAVGRVGEQQARILEAIRGLQRGG